MTTEISIGQRVVVKGETGVVRFNGRTEFAEGEWVGIELDSSLGKNNGEINGVRYFELEKKSGNYGVFVRPQLVESVDIHHEVPSNYNGNARPVSFSLSTSKDASEGISGTFSIQRPFTSLELNRGHEDSKSATIDEEQRLHSIILALQNKVKKMRDEIADLKNRLEISQREKLALTQRLEITEEALEHKTIDNELLEEQHVVLQTKIAELQETYDLVRQQLQDDSQHGGEVVTKVSSALTSVQVLSQSSEQSLSAEVSLLKAQLLHLQDIQQKLETTEGKLADAEILVDALRDQLDTNSSDKEFLEKLTQENLKLSEQVDRLQESVVELEQLQSLDEEVLLGHIEVENELKEEIKLLQNQSDNDKLLIHELKEKNLYFETKIKDFSQNSESSINLIPERGSNTLLKEKEISLAILQMENSSQRIEIDLQTLETIELRNFADKLKELADLPLDKIVSSEIGLKLKVSLEKMLVVSNTLFQKSSEQESNGIITQIFSMIASCGAALCFLKYLLRTLLVSQPNGTDRLNQLTNSIEKMVLDCTENAKKFDYENLSKNLKQLKSVYSDYTLEDLFANNTYRNKNRMLYDISRNLTGFVHPEAKFIGNILDFFLTLEFGNGQLEFKAMAIFDNYYSALSRFKVVLETKMSQLEELDNKSLEIEYPSTNEFPIHTSNLMPIAKLIQNEYNSLSSDADEEFVENVQKLAENELTQRTDEIEQSILLLQKLEYVTKTVDVTTTATNSGKRQSIVNDNAELTRDYDTLKEEILRMSKLIKEKETNLEELSLRISVLSRKLSEREIETAKFTSQSLKIKNLQGVNQKLVEDLQEAKSENLKFIEQIEEMKQQTKSFTGNFGNINEEKEYVQKSALIGEIHSLRNTLSHFLPDSIQIPEKWLVEEEQFPFAPKRNNFSTTKLAYRSLMKLNEEFTIMPVSSRTRNSRFPDYYLSAMRNKYSQYERLKSSI